MNNGICKLCGSPLQGNYCPNCKLMLLDREIAKVVNYRRVDCCFYCQHLKCQNKQNVCQRTHCGVDITFVCNSFEIEDYYKPAAPTYFPEVSK